MIEAKDLADDNLSEIIVVKGHENSVSSSTDFGETSFRVKTPTRDEIVLMQQLTDDLDGQHKSYRSSAMMEYLAEVPQSLSLSGNTTSTRSKSKWDVTAASTRNTIQQLQDRPNKISDSVSDNLEEAQEEEEMEEEKDEEYDMQEFEEVDSFIDKLRS